MFRSVLVVVITLLVFIAASCSKPPEVEMGNAAASLDQAKNVEAEQYATESYQKAIDSLNAAKVAKEEQDAKFSLFRKYDQVREMYVDAQQLADQAKSEAEVEKARLKEEVNSLVASLQSAIETADAAIAAAPVAKGSRVELEVYRSTLDSVREAFDNTKLDVEKGNYIVAKTKLEALLKKTTDITAEIGMANKKKSS